MRLSTAIIPPRPVLEEVMAVVRGNEPVPDDLAPRRGSWWRKGSVAPAGSGSATPAARELDFDDVDTMHLPIASFGNMTLGDSVQLATALRRQVASWRRPRLHLAGAAALEFEGDRSVWVKIEGDVDDLNAIGRGVPQVVQRLGFSVDRRIFRPWLEVATITDHTTEPYLQSVVDSLQAFQGRPWTVANVSLLERLAGSGSGHAFTVHEELPLAVS